MNLPEHRPGTPPADRAKSPARHQPGQIGYVDADAVGFERVPRPVAEVLWGRGVLAGSMWAGSAERPVTKRRSDGSHYQFAEAWWASESRLVQFEAARELAGTGDGRFRPAREWEIRGDVHEFSQPAVPARSTWRLDADAAGLGGRRPTRPRTSDPLEVLPPQVGAPVKGGESDAWREWAKGWAKETIVASRFHAGRVLLLRAERRASSRRALDTGEWVAETIDAAVVRSTPFVLGSSQVLGVPWPPRGVPTA